jgi:hypothetical protein
MWVQFPSALRKRAILRSRLFNFSLHGVYHHASKKHIARYVNEFTWRLNKGNVERHSLERLDSFVDAVAGKRITFRELTA